MRTIHASMITNSANPLQRMASSSELLAGTVLNQMNFGVLIVMPVLILLVRRLMKRVPQNLDIAAEFNAVRDRFLNVQPAPHAGGRTESAAPSGGEGTVEIVIKDMLKEKPTRYSSKQLAAFTHNFSVKLGSGGGGHVYRGVLPGGIQIAVKVLNHSSDPKSMEEQFMAEVGTIGRTHHRNLVRLYGFCFDSNLKALVYEYMENGSLDKVLFGREHRVIEWEKLYEMAIGAARGLKYLHDDCHKRIIHLDIKPANVLLDSNFCPKLADFGLAKLSNIDSSSPESFSPRGGTRGYAAPEIWMPVPVTCKCDVYSFGMMLFDIVGLRRNLDWRLGESQEWFLRRVWEKLEKGELEELLVESGIKERDMAKAKRMCVVALWCAQGLPHDRPPMNEVLKMLEGEDQIQTPTNPTLGLAPSHIMVSINSSESSINSCGNETNDRLIPTPTNPVHGSTSSPIMAPISADKSSSINSGGHATTDEI